MDLQVGGGGGGGGGGGSVGGASVVHFTSSVLLAGITFVASFLIHQLFGPIPIVFHITNMLCTLYGRWIQS